MRNQLKNTQMINYKLLLDELVELTDSNGDYTGELVNKYSPISQLRVVLRFVKGTYSDEQSGVIYSYETSMQHTGKPVMVEGALVWVNNETTKKADYKVRKVLPSLNYTQYILETNLGAD